MSSEMLPSICPACQAQIAVAAPFCGLCGARLSAASAPPKDDPPQDPFIGRTLEGKYKICKKIGQGAAGIVYEAEHLTLSGRVAVKLLHAASQSEEHRARFRREALILSRLRHPLVVKVYEYGATQDGWPFLVMELLDGETLDSYLTTHKTIEPTRLLELLRPVCEVLSEAHQQGIIHRDIKPQNIMLVSVPGGKSLPKLLDFGLASLWQEERLTMSKAVSGSPRYMAPEQWDSLKNADERSDIYSLGVVAYECLSGRLPFDAGSPIGWMKAHKSEPPLDLASTIPAALREVMMSALSKDPGERPKTILAFLQALEASLTQDKPELTPATLRAVPPIQKRRGSAPAPKGTEPSQEKRRWPLVLLSLSIASALGLSLYYFSLPPAPLAASLSNQSPVSAPVKTQAPHPGTPSTSEPTLVVTPQQESALPQKQPKKISAPLIEQPPASQPLPQSNPIKDPPNVVPKPNILDGEIVLPSLPSTNKVTPQ